MAEHRTDIEIARAAKKKPIAEIGEKLGIPLADLVPYGHDKAKISAEFIKRVRKQKDGKLILVTAVNPTPAGEGKTTTTVGLGDGLNRIGKKAIVCIREASLGPNFGVKGGAAGGGHAQIVPMEDMNLHFTGDFHAITTAHNLLAALIDNHIYWGNELGIDTRRVVWRRVMDMNDRALREIICSLGGAPNGYPRESGFDITVASEVMAILCLATDLKDLQKRLGDIIVAYRRDKTAVYARDLKADGSMAVLLKDAMQPNLVQTLENNPAFVHGGPFANIAHGCNSVVATTTALKLADYVVTEAGFGADLGAEKFFDIKCRKAHLHPAAAVVVATVRAMKMNGGVKKEDLAAENVAAVKKGCANLGRHVENVKQFGVPAIVAINHFTHRHGGRNQGDARLCRRAWRRGGRVQALGARLGRHRVACAQGGGTCGARPRAVLAALPRRHEAVRQDQHHRQAHLSRLGSDRRQVGPRPVACLGSGRLWHAAGLHGEDAVLLLHRSKSARRADRPCRAGARGAPGRRRRLRRGDLRRDHDHARPAQGAVE